MTLNTKIAKYGSTGMYSTGPHLHVEVDTDTTYWNYTPTISSASGSLRAGTRDVTDSHGVVTGTTETTTRNPLEVFRVKKSAPENQTLSIEYDEDYRILGSDIKIFY